MIESRPLLRTAFIFNYPLAATAVVVAAAVVVAVAVVTAVAIVAVTAEQNEDYKDDDPGAVVAAVVK